MSLLKANFENSDNIKLKIAIAKVLLKNHFHELLFLEKQFYKQYINIFS